MIDSQTILPKLKSISLFKELAENEQAMQALISIGKMVSFNDNQVVFFEGEIGKSLYIPILGSFEIIKKTPEGDNYTVLKLNADTPVFFGEMALIDDEKRSATVVATTQGETFCIDRLKFDEFSKKHPEWALPIVREIARALASRLRKTTDDMLKIFNALVEEIKN